MGLPGEARPARACTLSIPDITQINTQQSVRISRLACGAAHFLEASEHPRPAADSLDPGMPSQQPQGSLPLSPCCLQALCQSLT